jgi:hypothetical protein
MQSAEHLAHIYIGAGAKNLILAKDFLAPNTQALTALSFSPMLISPGRSHVQIHVP